MWSNFTDMWGAVGFSQAPKNSMIISCSLVLICLPVAILAGYATARFTFRGQSSYRQFLPVTQMLSPIVLVIGIFRMMAKLGIVDQPLGRIPACVALNTAFATWMLQCYFATKIWKMRPGSTMPPGCKA